MKHYFLSPIFTVTIIKQTYGSSKSLSPTACNENEGNDLSIDPLEKTLKARLCHL